MGKGYGLNSKLLGEALDGVLDHVLVAWSQPDRVPGEVEVESARLAAGRAGRWGKRKGGRRCHSHSVRRGESGRGDNVFSRVRGGRGGSGEGTLVMVPFERVGAGCLYGDGQFVGELPLANCSSEWQFFFIKSFPRFPLFMVILSPRQD